MCRHVLIDRFLQHMHACMHMNNEVKLISRQAEEAIPKYPVNVMGCGPFLLCKRAWVYKLSDRFLPQSLRREVKEPSELLLLLLFWQTIFTCGLWPRARNGCLNLEHCSRGAYLKKGIWHSEDGAPQKMEGAKKSEHFISGQTQLWIFLAGFPCRRLKFKSLTGLFLLLAILTLKEGADKRTCGG